MIINIINMWMSLTLQAVTFRQLFAKKKIFILFCISKALLFQWSTFTWITWYITRENICKIIVLFKNIIRNLRTAHMPYIRGFFFSCIQFHLCSKWFLNRGKFDAKVCFYNIVISFLIKKTYLEEYNELCSVNLE